MTQKWLFGVSLKVTWKWHTSDSKVTFRVKNDTKKSNFWVTFVSFFSSHFQVDPEESLLSQFLRHFNYFWVLAPLKTQTSIFNIWRFFLQNILRVKILKIFWGSSKYLEARFFWGFSRILRIFLWVFSLLQDFVIKAMIEDFLGNFQLHGPKKP